MKISGFSFARHAASLYFPLAQAVASILPLVDEFVVALDPGDPPDDTLAQLEALQSPKLRILPTRWDLETYPRGMVHAQQTDFAKSHCSGDWLFYLQADEVIHEKDLPNIRQRCAALLHHQEVEGLLFRYKHFWGDYQHCHNSHGWYKHEIRIIRNDPDIHSWESAQSFRRIPNFDGRNYRQQEGTYKLKVASVDADVYHYGYVRPPDLMQRKSKTLDTIHHGSAAAEVQHARREPWFDYGDMRKIPRFHGTHPAVMQPVIDRFDWGEHLRYDGRKPDRPLFKHERLKYRLLSWVENTFLGGKVIGGFKNWIYTRP